jgi:uncharacterized protein YqjF (DUF2071 family)
LNLRTYVRHGDEAGITFLSLHAGSWLGVRLARWLTPLPYARATIKLQQDGEHFSFQCRGAGQKASGEVAFAVHYTPGDARFQPVAGSLDEWLLERYSLFVNDARGRLLQTVVQHDPWTVQSVQGQVIKNTLGKPFSLALDGPPERMNYSAGMSALIARFDPIKT